MFLVLINDDRVKIGLINVVLNSLKILIIVIQLGLGSVALGWTPDACGSGKRARQESSSKLRRKIMFSEAQLSSGDGEDARSTNQANRQNSWINWSSCGGVNPKQKLGN